jgi:hypothetical protein
MLNTLLLMFTSLERLVEFKRIPQEAARDTPADAELPEVPAERDHWKMATESRIVLEEA